MTPESARLLGRDPSTSIRSMSRLQTIDAARQSQHDACLMTLNLNVLDQYVLCLQGTATKLLELTVSRHDFPSAALESAAPVPRVGCASVHMEAMGLLWVRMIRFRTLLVWACLLLAHLPANPIARRPAGSCWPAVELFITLNHCCCWRLFLWFSKTGLFKQLICHLY